MSLTASVQVDLTGVPRERLRHRVHALSAAPDGARAVVNVGSIAVEPDSARILREQIERLHIDVRGEPRAVQRWVDALSRGFLGGAA